MEIGSPWGQKFRKIKDDEEQNPKIEFKNKKRVIRKFKKQAQAILQDNYQRKEKNITKSISEVYGLSTYVTASHKRSVINDLKRGLNVEK